MWSIVLQRLGASLVWYVASRAVNREVVGLLVCSHITGLAYGLCVFVVVVVVENFILCLHVYSISMSGYVERVVGVDGTHMSLSSTA